MVKSRVDPQLRVSVMYLCPSADRTAAEVPECLSGPGPLLCCMEWRWGWEKAERAWASGGITNAMTSAVLPALKNDQPRRGSVAAARLSLSVCVKGLSQYNAAKGQPRQLRAGPTRSAPGTGRDANAPQGRSPSRAGPAGLHRRARRGRAGAQPPPQRDPGGGRNRPPRP